MKILVQKIKNLFERIRENGTRLNLLIIAVISFLLTFTGSLLSDQNLFFAIYNSIGAFFGIDSSFLSAFESTPVLLLGSGKLLAVLITAGIICGLLIERFHEFFSTLLLILPFNKKSFILYSDNKKIYDYLKDKNLKVYRFSKPNSITLSVNNQLFAYEDDEKSLKTYLNCSDKLKNKKSAIILNTLDSSMFDIIGANVISINKLISKRFWLNLAEEAFLNSDSFFCIKNHEEQKCSIDISILGSNDLARSMIDVALKNNIYSSKQVINYNVFSDDEYFEKYALDMSVYSDGEEHDSVKIIKSNLIKRENINIMNDSHIVIICENNSRLIQEILINMTMKKDGKKKMVFIYDTDNKNVYSAVNQELDIRTFGLNDSNPELFTIDSERIAKKINYFYSCPSKNDETDKKHKEDELWLKTGLYGRRSSLASADYHEFRKLYLDKKDNLDKAFDELKVLEHIRWVRFMLLDGWSIGEKKDREMKKHPDIIPFDELSEEEKKKDEDVLNYLKNI